MMRRLGAAATVVTVVAAAVLVAGGLLRQPRPDLEPGHIFALLRVACAAGGAAFLLLLTARVGRWRPWAAAGVLAVATAVFTGQGGAVAAVLFLLLSWWALGAALLRWLRVEQFSPSVAEATLAGAGVVGTLIALTAARPVHHFWLYLAVLALPVVFGRSMLRSALAGWRQTVAAQEPAGSAAALLEALSGGLLLVYFVVALLPEIGHDALAMHLFVPAQLAQRHQWHFDAGTYVWAVMPMLVDWMFAAAYMLGGETAARLLNVALLGGVALLTGELVRWSGGGRWASRCAVVLLLSIPLTFTLGSSLFIELGWTSFVLAGMLAVLRTGEKGAGMRALVPAGLFLGFALGSKAVTLTILPVLFVLLVARCRTWWSDADRVRTALLGAGLLALFGLPPYVNAWLRTGNPVFPFFNARFQSPLYPAQNFESASTFSRGLRWDFPYGVVFEPTRYIEGLTGSGGFQWLLVLVPATIVLLFVRQRRALALWLIALGMMAIAFQSVAYLRYVFPSFVLSCVVAGVALASAELGRPARIALSFAAAAAVGLNLVFFGAASLYGDFPFRSVVDQDRREAWLELRQPMRPAIALVNALNKGEAPVAVLGPPALGQLAADALMPSWYNFRFERSLLAQESGPAMVKLLQGAGVEYVLLDQEWPRPRQRELVESVTEPVASFGQVSVRRWRAEYRFQRELLSDSEFATGAGWQFVGDARLAPGVVSVTVQAPASQTVPVQPGRHYLNTITISCAEPTQGRLQVNWSAQDGAFVKADIRVVECAAQPTTHVMEVVAPPGAAQATVYASAHADKRVEFRKDSFRQ